MTVTALSSMVDACTLGNARLARAFSIQIMYM